MELIFNELSLLDKPDNKYKAISILENFAKTCSAFKKEGFNKLRVESDFWTTIYFDKRNLIDFLQKIPSRTQQSLLRSFIRKPYIADDFISEADDKYVQNEYFYGTFKVVGLAYAYLLNTMAVSLLTSPIWEETEIQVIERNDTSENQISVKSASKPEHTISHKDWIENQKPITLLKTNKKPAEKEIKLRNDHGKDILKNFSKKLIKSEYVTRIINSLPFNPTETNFIHKIYPNGQIEIVLTDTDQGFGIIIQTTGRNLRETSKISNILENKYK